MVSSSGKGEPVARVRGPVIVVTWQFLDLDLNLDLDLDLASRGRVLRSAWLAFCVGLVGCTFGTVNLFHRLLLQIPGQRHYRLITTLADCHI